ncbi:hypothetical protein DY000_02005479 [Brassica cretica]|uniref:Uncharacterized protein n=1 Tax=Brassica cretica TaxID=69181 RepID=A0ABQ7C1U6_BRACR|nr:hypothetical protein DY000_02005479 [Brassica cretica]
MAEEDQEEDPMQAEYKHNVATLEAGNDDEELWNAPYRETLFSEDYYPVEMFNAGSNVGSMSQKRKTWMQEANGNMTKFANLVAGDQAEAMKIYLFGFCGEFGRVEIYYYIIIDNYWRYVLGTWFEKASVSGAMALSASWLGPQRFGTPLPGEVDKALALQCHGARR